ncbi:MAG TPA: DegT/DnrJ/EryC1/StrS family aminotransferase [Anaerolineales bacterium]|nr:DegT/DnrJ/EryC1/StrS family aminotransferase [Anaerolineales bacterium]
MDWRIPLSDIDFGPEEAAAVQQVVQSRWLTMGAITQDFEREFAAYVGARHAIAVTNATAALHLACLVAGLGPGDEAIVPSLTFVATANAVRYTGADVRFGDIESEDWLNISAEAINNSITSRTRAIVVVHYGGYPCDMASILGIAHRHGLKVIEDAAHAIGSELGGKKLGTWGDVGCYSFFSNKNMTTGEGGMLTTSDDGLAEHLRLLRSHGMTSLSWDRFKGHAWSYDVVDLGYNYRIDEIRSSLGRAQLAKLEGNNARRRELTAIYHEYLEELVPEITIPFRAQRGLSACHLLPILLPRGNDRTRFMEAMKSYGIQTSIHYPPVHQFRIYQSEKGHGGISLPNTEQVAAREVTLPLYPSMTKSDVQVVAQAVRESLVN